MDEIFYFFSKNFSDFILDDSIIISLIIYLILSIIVAVICLVIFGINRVKKRRGYKKGYSRRNYQNFSRVPPTRAVHNTNPIFLNTNNEAIDIKKEFEVYKALVNKNFRKVFSYGEVILIDSFKELLSRPEYKNWTIYGHLNLKDSEYFKHYQADFLIVSDKGIFVIESKLWNGLTLIYKGMTPELFAGTQFSDYGKDQDTGVKVFNINSKSDGEGLEINKYSNPVTQARHYSKLLRKWLNQKVYNYVVFQKDEYRQVKINNRDFDYYCVDNYTSIMTQEYFPKYLQELKTYSYVDLDKTNSIIQKHFEYEILLNSDNVNEPPWGGEYI